MSEQGLRMSRAIRLGLEQQAVVPNNEVNEWGALNAGEDEVQTSIAVSLKRIADRLEGFDLTPLGNQLLEIAYQAGINFRGQA